MDDQKLDLIIALHRELREDIRALQESVDKHVKEDAIVWSKVSKQEGFIKYVLTPVLTILTVLAGWLGLTRP